MIGREKIYQEFPHFQVNVAVKNVQKVIADTCLKEDAQGVPLELNSAQQFHSGFVQSVLAKEKNNVGIFSNNLDNESG